MRNCKNGWLAIAKRLNAKNSQSKSIELPAALEAELADVRAAVPPPASDDPIYKYLEEIYRVRCKAERSTKLQDAIKSAHRAKFPGRLRNYTGVIIGLTAPDVPAKRRHKYIFAIEYAFRKAVKPDDFVAFVKDQGGINKCCEQWTKA